MSNRVDRRLLWRSVLVCLPLLVYLNSLQNPFHYDDLHSIVENPHIRELRNIPAFFVDPTLFSAESGNAMYRPLLLSSFALNYAISGHQVWSYHLGSILLHLGCVLLVWEIGRMLLGSDAAAGTAALVFGLHPINTEPLNYISSRSEVLAGLFLLLGLWAFLRRRESGGGLMWLAVAFVAGLLSKSIVIVFPALLLGYDLIVDHPQQRKDVKLYGVLGGMSLLYLGMVWKFLKKATVEEPVRGYSEQIWTQVKAFVFYVKLLLWPAGLNVDHQFLISDTFFDPFAASALAFLVSLVGLGLYHWKRHPLPLFLLAWLLLVLAPSSLIPLNVLVNEHRLYVPSAAFALMVGYLFKLLEAKGGSWRRAGGALVLVSLLGYAGVTVKRNRVWADVYSLWGDAAAKAPLMARPFIFLGDAYDRDGRKMEAMRAFERVIQRDPAFTPAYAKLGKLYLGQGRYGDAEEMLRKGLEKEPGDADLWTSLGEVHRDQGRWRECLKAYLEAVRFGEEDDALHNNLGNAYQMTGKPQEALVHHLRALEINPGDARTWLNIGNAHLMMGEYQESIGNAHLMEEAYQESRSAYLKAIELDSLFAGAWMNLGILHEKLGQMSAALEAYERGVRIDPGYAGFVEERRGVLQDGNDD